MSLINTVHDNLQAFRKDRRMTHKRVAEQINRRIGGGLTPSQSQNNERALSMPYARLEALAEIFNTEPWQFFVKDPPDLEEYRKSLTLTNK